MTCEEYADKLIEEMKAWRDEELAMHDIRNWPKEEIEKLLSCM